MGETDFEFDAPLVTVVIPGSFDRVAVISDVHGNLPALEACLQDVSRESVEAMVFLGDLTWGPQPREVLDRTSSLPVPCWFVRGNGERAIVQMAGGTRETEGSLDEWMIAAHGSDGVDEIATFAPAVSIAVGATGNMRLCHGSPRSDIELLTPATPAERIARAIAEVTEDTIGHGHTHLQYQRRVDERTVFGPGSVGIPYGTDGRPGARWALVADSIDLRMSPYDIEVAIDAARSVGYPGLVNYERYLRTPPTLAEIVEDAEAREFAD